jgi:uncharacterized protein (DUF2147 family)
MPDTPARFNGAMLNTSGAWVMLSFSKKMFVRGLLLSSLALLAPLVMAQTAGASPPSSDPRGRWITASGNLEVEIAPCGAALCGTVTKVLGNKSMSRDGAEMVPVDTRPALGMSLLHDFVRSDGGDEASPASEWSGQIYNRENGKTYSCLMSVSTESKPTGELVLRPYVGMPLFGKTQRWQRVAAAAVEPGRRASQP